MKDLIVLGAGPAGYVGALRAAQLDRDVLVVDKLDRAGGLCLNWGCIPTKTLLHLAAEYNFIDSAEQFGFDCELNGVDWEKMISHSRSVVEKLTRGIEGLFKKNGIELVHQEGQLIAPGEVKTADGNVHRAENILVATGAKINSFPDIQPNKDRIMTCREALTLREQPEKMVVLGGGPIGLEFAYFYQTFGTEVKVLEMADQILPGMDSEVVNLLHRQLEELGIEIHTSTAVDTVKQQSSEAVVETAAGEEFTAPAALLALGMEPPEDSPWEADLELQTTESGWLEVDDLYQTSQASVYAAGDITGPPLLAHVASAEAEKAVEAMFELEPDPLDYDKIPTGIYCRPQVGAFGLTEAEARSQYSEVKVGKFPFQALGRAQADGATEGFVKLVFSGDYSELVGAHIIGEKAVELLPELTVGARLEVTPEEIFETVHAHPTHSEAVREAALAAVGRPLHV